MKQWDSQCRGKHSLIDILSVEQGYGESKTVRWCTRCGAIVVDQDFDGRTNPGRYMEMLKPCYR